MVGLGTGNFIYYSVLDAVTQDLPTPKNYTLMLGLMILKRAESQISMLCAVLALPCAASDLEHQ